MKYIVLDIETTGLYPEKGDKIIEIAAVPIINEDVRRDECFHSYVNPGIKIPNFITKLTKITDEMVADSPKIDVILPRLIDYIKDYPLIAHNAEFDIGFLNHFLVNYGFEKISNRIVDTLHMSREVFSKNESHSLKNVAERLKIDTRDLNHHNALDDAVITAMVFLKLRALL